MSRIGKKPVVLPKGVDVAVVGGVVSVKGPKGSLETAVVRLTSVEVVEGTIVVSRANDSKPARSYHGLMRSLLNNMVVGVSEGFEKKLAVKGVGYRADVRGSVLKMALGYSHPVDYPIPAGVEIAVDKSNVISVKGIDKQQVGQVAAVIRGFRPPEHYKGKGIRYVNEVVRLKAGKSA